MSRRAQNALSFRRTRLYHVLLSLDQPALTSIAHQYFQSLFVVAFFIEGVGRLSPWLAIKRWTVAYQQFLFMSSILIKHIERMSNPFAAP